MTRYCLRALSLAAAIALSGCAATVHRSPADNGATASASKVAVPVEARKRIVLNVAGTQQMEGSADWEVFKAEWRSAFKNAALSAGMGYDYTEKADFRDVQPGTLVKVVVQDYRYISPGARYGFGVLTGNAYVQATIGLLDARDGTSFGEQAFNTSSTAWQGVFSAMTEKQIAAIAGEVIGDINGR